MIPMNGNENILTNFDMACEENIAKVVMMNY